jgi:F0F1-type ATP synthase membrane subunit b/b'
MTSEEYEQLRQQIGKREERIAEVERQAHDLLASVAADRAAVKRDKARLRREDDRRMREDYEKMKAERDELKAKLRDSRRRSRQEPEQESGRDINVEGQMQIVTE